MIAPACHALLPQVAAVKRARHEEGLERRRRRRIDAAREPDDHDHAVHGEQHVRLAKRGACCRVCHRQQRQRAEQHHDETGLHQPPFLAAVREVAAEQRE
jgi:hypothetical protein